MMINPERFEGSDAKPERPRLRGIEGAVVHTWHSTPEDLSIPTPIDPQLFMPGSLIRNLRSSPDATHREVHNRKKVYVTKAHTSPAAIIGEVYRILLPPDARDFGSYQTAQAEAAEADYYEQGLDQDVEYQLLTRENTMGYDQAAVLQGIAAFRAAADEFYNSDMYGRLFKDAEYFARHLMVLEQTP